MKPPIKPYRLVLLAACGVDRLCSASPSDKAAAGAQWWDDRVDIPRLALLLSAACDAAKWVNSVAMPPSYPCGTAGGPWETSLVLSLEALPPLVGGAEGAHSPGYLVRRCTRALECQDDRAPLAWVSSQRAGALAKVLRMHDVVLHAVESVDGPEGQQKG